MTRIVSLLPGATEIVAALGAGDQLVGISHECDYPPWVQRLPRLTSTLIDPTSTGQAIDVEVRSLMAAGRPAVTVDADTLIALRPDLLITQSLCDVCAVANGEVRGLSTILDPPPEVLTMGGRTLAGVFEDIDRIGTRLDVPEEAEELVAGLRYRLRRIAGSCRPTRVLCIEWLDPLYLAGHWVPELVEAAGGTDVGAMAGAPSARREWEEVAALSPETIVIMLCGFDVARSKQELAGFMNAEARAGRSPLGLGCPVWILDGNAYTSRAGPRLVEGAERIAAALRGVEGHGLTRVS